MRTDARWLERALLFTFFAHGAGMLSMAAFLLPGMPGGTAIDAAARIAYVGNYPWLWRAGWLGWQITALSDFLLALALLCTPWIPKLPAVLTMAFTVLGLIPDQIGQALWTWVGTDLARQALHSGSNDAYLAFETRTFHWIAAWGTVGYLTAALGWTWCFAAARTWSRRLTWLSVAVWTIFAAATGVLFLPVVMLQSKMLAAAVSVGNAAAFVLLMIWLAAVTEAVLRRSRPTTRFGEHAPWRHPANNIWNRFYNLLANSRFAHSLCEYLPSFGMTSSVTDALYINYLVSAETLIPFVPPGLQLQTLGPGNRYALFTILTYRHGHFAPRWSGSLRRFFPSPIQSNWRLYLIDPHTQKPGIYFLTIALTNTLQALAARLLSQGVAMHVPAAAELGRDSDGAVRLRLEPGAGSAPDIAATFRASADIALPAPWSDCFASWNEMLAYCVPQNRALSIQPWYNRVTRQEIRLDISLDQCRRVTGDVSSRIVSGLVGPAQPLCFTIDPFEFLYLGQEYDPR